MRVFSWFAGPSRAWQVPTALRAVAAVLAATGALLLVWHVFTVVGASVEASHSILEGRLGPVTGAPKVFYPSRAINPLGSLRAAADSLSTWALLRAAEFRKSAHIVPAVPDQPSPVAPAGIEALRRRESPIQPLTGFLMSPKRPFGVGRLTVTNRTGLDAAIRVVSSLQEQPPARFLYVRAGQKLTIRDLPPGEFFVHVEMGTGWRPSAKMFSADYRAVERIGPLSYVQIQSAEGFHSDHHQIELRPPRSPGARTQ